LEAFLSREKIKERFRIFLERPRNQKSGEVGPLENSNEETDRGPTSIEAGEPPVLEITTPNDQAPLEWCDNSHLGLCDTREKCEGQNLYWYGEQCHLGPEAIIEIEEPELAPEPETEPEPVLETTTPSTEL